MAQCSDDGHEDNDEARPLLPVTESPDPRILTSPAHRTRCSWPWRYVVATCVGLAVLSCIGEDLYMAPRVRLFESVVCARYYSQNDPSLVGGDGFVSEEFCKINPVQDEVALVLGWQLFFDSIPAILLPIPYGYIADKYGRKLVLFPAMVGFTLSWASTLFFVGVLHTPLQYVWLSSLFFVVGGGPTVATTLITTMVADVVPPELRSTVFFYRFCTDLIAECFVPPVTSFLMSKNIWIPLLAAVVFQGSGTLMTLILPETLPVVIPEQVSEALPEADEESVTNKSWKLWIWQTRKSFEFVTRDTVVAALVFTFLFSKIGRQSSNILLQYVSKRYEWSLSQAGLLLSLRAVVNIVLYTIILPLITTFALSRIRPAVRDLWIAKASIVLMVLGTLLLFSSSTAVLMIIGLVVYTLGTGFAPIVRSLVTFLVESHHASNTSDIARLYAIISVMEGIGSLLAGPGMAWAFRIGMSLGQEWYGLPFGLATALFVLVSVVILRIKV